MSESSQWDVMIEEMSMFYPLFMFYLSAIEDYGLEIVTRKCYRDFVGVCVCVCLCVGVCVVPWLSQLGHELFGRAASTEAGFVRAFGTPRSLVHTIECGYTHTHTHTRIKCRTDKESQRWSDWWKGSATAEEIEVKTPETKQIICTLHLTPFFHLI